MSKATLDFPKGRITIKYQPLYLTQALLNFSLTKDKETVVG
jgi:hypothetical protein